MNKEIENEIRLVIKMFELDAFIGVKPGKITDEFKYELLNKANYWLTCIKEKYGDSDEILDMFFNLLEQTFYKHLS